MNSARFRPKDALLERLRSRLAVLKKQDALSHLTPRGENAEEPHDGLWERVDAMNQRWQLKPEPFHSARPIIGPLLVKLRQLFNRISTVQFVIPLANQQMSFNNAAVQCCQYLMKEIRKLRAEMRPSAVGGEISEEGFVDLHRNLGELKVLLRAQQRRIAALEREVARPHEAPPPLLHGFDYFRFEQRFRGDPNTIREKQRQYIPYFQGASEVLDIGCGRGEFMELLREAGISSVGVDSDSAMAAECRRKNLEVHEADLLTHLRKAPDGGYGGAYAAQLVEHLQPTQLTELVQLLGRTLRAGSPVVIETINPLCLIAAQTHYRLDLTHARLIPPELLVFLLESAGFEDVEVKYSSLTPENLRLKTISPPEGEEKGASFLEIFNQNVKKINDVFLGYQDYAVCARKRAE